MSDAGAAIRAHTAIMFDAETMMDEFGLSVRAGQKGPDKKLSRQILYGRRQQHLQAVLELLHDGDKSPRDSSTVAAPLPLEHVQRAIVRPSFFLSFFNLFLIFFLYLTFSDMFLLFSPCLLDSHGSAPL